MEKVRFNDTEYEIEAVEFLSSHVLKITFNTTNDITSINTNVEILTTGGQVCADYKGFTTIYKTEGVELYLSNDESVYVEPEPIVPDSNNTELTENQKAIIEKQNEINQVKSEISVIDAKFDELDYIGIKIATGRATIEDYPEEIAEMTALATRKDELNAQLAELENQLSGLESEVA